MVQSILTQKGAHLTVGELLLLLEHYTADTPIISIGVEEIEGYGALTDVIIITEAPNDILEEFPELTKALLFCGGSFS